MDMMNRICKGAHVRGSVGLHLSIGDSRGEATLRTRERLVTVGRVHMVAPESAGPSECSRACPWWAEWSRSGLLV